MTAATSDSDVPHGEDDTIDVEQRHQWLDLRVRRLGASGLTLLLEAGTALRTLSCGQVFMRLGAIGGNVGVVDCRMHADRGGGAHVLVTVLVNHVLQDLWLVIGLIVDH